MKILFSMDVDDVAMEEFAKLDPPNSVDVLDFLRIRGQIKGTQPHFEVIAINPFIVGSVEGVVPTEEAEIMEDSLAHWLADFGRSEVHCFATGNDTVESEDL